MRHINWSLAPITRSWNITEQWAEHCEEHGCILTGPFGEPTHRDGGVLDLAWASAEAQRLWAINTRLAPELANSSDHLPILTSVDNAAPTSCVPRGRFRLEIGMPSAKYSRRGYLF